MNEDTLDAIAADAAAGLAVLCGSYTLLFDHRLPGSPKVGTIGRSAPGSRAPVSAHLVDLIREVERLAYWADEAVCAWLNQTFLPYGLDWGGEPNPLVAFSLGSAARDLPRATPWAGHAVVPLAASVSRTVERVQRVLGPSGGAELADGECPDCHSRTLVRLHSPDRVGCAGPGCEYLIFNIPRKAAV